MKELKHVPLKEITKIRTGYAVRGRLIEDPDGAFSIIQMKDASPEGINWGELVRINPVGLSLPDFLKPNDIVFCGRGTRIFAVPISTVDSNTAAGQQFFVLTPQSNLPAEYIAWYINSSPAQHYFRKNAGASLLINVNRRVLENCTIPLPNDNDIHIFAELVKSVNHEKQIMDELYAKKQQLLESIILKGLNS